MHSVALGIPLGMEPISKKLKELGEEVTLENWLRLAYPGENKKLSDLAADEIEDIPPYLVKIHKIKNANRNTKKTQ